MTKSKPRNKAALRYNSLIRHTNRHARSERHARIKEEQRHRLLILQNLELQAAKDNIAIELSKKNEAQVLGWII
jgi:hypothetical protein